MSGPSYLFGDNQSAISNTTAPETQLKKKSNSIAYHWVCESVASGELYEKKTSVILFVSCTLFRIAKIISARGDSALT